MIERFLARGDEVRVVLKSLEAKAASRYFCSSRFAARLRLPEGAVQRLYAVPEILHCALLFVDFVRYGISRTTVLVGAVYVGKRLGGGCRRL